MAKKENEALSAYVSEVEEAPIERKEATVTPVYNEPQNEVPAEPQNRNTAAHRESVMHGTRVPTDDPQVRGNLGYLKIPVESLPTQGLFYPAGFEVSIRAARGEEIKHWSTMNDEDIMQISRTDDILNYMIERCCSVKNPERPGNAWQDLKNVDRFYILLSIKEFTFIKGENQLMVPNPDGADVPVTKEMVDFINVPEDIMEFYSPEEKCFVFTVNNQVIKMHVPSLGVNTWLKNYAMNKQNNREPFDQDFLNYAPMLIRDYRNLSQRAYEQFVSETQLWGVDEWSVVSYVTKILSDATEPKIKYITEGGEEKEIPLSFRGGIRAIFVIPDPLRAVRRS